MSRGILVNGPFGGSTVEATLNRASSCFAYSVTDCATIVAGSLESRRVEHSVLCAMMQHVAPDLLGQRRVPQPQALDCDDLATTSAGDA